MQLHEIITSNGIDTESFLIEKMIPYKKSLMVYYTNLFCSEPFLMVTDVFNACQYGKIVSGNDFNDAIYAYLGVDYVSNDSDDDDFDADLFAQYETICFNSIPLNKL